MDSQQGVILQLGGCPTSYKMLNTKKESSCLFSKNLKIKYKKP